MMATVAVRQGGGTSDRGGEKCPEGNVRLPDGRTDRLQ